MKTLPSSRKDGIIVRELQDEVLIYDLQRDKAHCLNKTAGFVWHHCDGRTRIATVARLLANKEQTPVVESVILLALDQLAERHLLADPLSRPADHGQGVAAKVGAEVCAGGFGTAGDFVNYGADSRRGGNAD